MELINGNPWYQLLRLCFWKIRLWILSNLHVFTSLLSLFIMSMPMLLIQIVFEPILVFIYLDFCQQFWLQLMRNVNYNQEWGKCNSSKNASGITMINLGGSEVFSISILQFKASCFVQTWSPLNSQTCAPVVMLIHQLSSQ